jgi:NAD+ kinase
MDPFEVRRVAIVAKPGVSEGYFERLVAALQKRRVEISEVRSDDQPDGSTEPDLVFVLGGDGTMLKASRMYPGRVLLGVNLGKVGFMSGMIPDEIEAGVEKVWGGGLEVLGGRRGERGGVVRFQVRWVHRGYAFRLHGLRALRGWSHHLG